MLDSDDGGSNHWPHGGFEQCYLHNMAVRTEQPTDTSTMIAGPSSSLKRIPIDSDTLIPLS